jgi:hypothetical protein
MENAKIIFFRFYMRPFFTNLAKYIVEGLVVALVAYYIPKKQTDLKTVGMIGIIAALTFALLDYFSPSIGASSRLGAGFGIGSNLVGFGGPGLSADATAVPSIPSISLSGAGYEGFYEPAPIPTTPVAVTDGNGQRVYVNVPASNKPASAPVSHNSKLISNYSNGVPTGETSPNYHTE